MKRIDVIVGFFCKDQHRPNREALSPRGRQTDRTGTDETAKQSVESKLSRRRYFPSMQEGSGEAEYCFSVVCQCVCPWKKLPL